MVCPADERALVERDWRMQDGIETPREPCTYAAAIERTLERGDSLAADLQRSGVTLGRLRDEWASVHREWERLSKDTSATDARWEDLWRRVHVLRRRMVLANPLAAHIYR